MIAKYVLSFLIFVSASSMAMAQSTGSPVTQSPEDSDRINEILAGSDVGDNDAIYNGVHTLKEKSMLDDVVSALGTKAAKNICAATDCIARIRTLCKSPNSKLYYQKGVVGVSVDLSGLCKAPWVQAENTLER